MKYALLFSIFLSVQCLFGQNKYLEGFSQGTTFHITYVDSNNISPEARILEILLEVDSSLSTYNPESLLSRINRNETKKVDTHIKACFQLSKQLHRSSEGVFDPTILPLLDYYGMGPTRSKKNQGDLDSIRQLVGLDGVHLRCGKLQKKHEGTRLDFNAVAQGYSVDLIADYFEKSGVANYLIELGGEIRLKGKDADGAKWRIGVERPSKEMDSTFALIIEPDAGGVATSGNYRRFMENNGEIVGHQLDPRTGGKSASNVVSATVVAPNAALADAYATILCLLPIEEDLLFLNKLNGVEVFLIYSDEGKTETFESDGFLQWIAP